eukprot:jgi/Psemu1/39777/gm1.39777_g
MDSSSVAAQAETAYTFVQRMNDSAALCVEIGEYDRAIASLTKALRISRSRLEGTQERCDPEESSVVAEEEGESCRCHRCSLDGCIQFSEHRHQTLPSFLSRNADDVHNRSGIFADNRRESSMHRRFLLRRRQHHRARLQEELESLNRNNSSYDSVNDRSGRNGPSLLHAREKSLRASIANHPAFRDEVAIDRNDWQQRGDKFEVYQEFIRVPTRSAHNKCHTIGSLAMVTVSLITLFNLAMVHHLQVIRYAATARGKNNTHSHTGNYRATIEKTLKLYQVVYNALEKHKQEQQYNGNTPTSETCLQFQMILCNNLSHVHKLTGNEFQHETYLRELLSTLMSVMDYKARRNLSGQEYSEGERRFLNLEGFVANTVPLISNVQCASAA